MSVPHFLRCPWCGTYLSEDQYAEVMRGKHCCQFCTKNLSEPQPHEKIWLRCPICLQVVRMAGDSSALSIHLSHLSAQRRGRIERLLAKPTALKKNLDDEVPELWTEEFSQRAVKLGILSALPLESRYPIDCDRLFWYHHRFC